MTSGEVLLIKDEEGEEEDEFFDSREEDGMSPHESCRFSTDSLLNSVRIDPDDLNGYNQQCSIWLTTPGSIEERRDNFIKWMDLMSPQKDFQVGEPEGAACGNEVEFRSVDSEHRHSTPGWSGECSCSSENELDENYLCMIKNLDDGSVFVADEVSQDGSMKSLHKVGTDRIITVDELHRSLSSSFVQHMMRREDNASASSLTSSEASDERASSRRRIGWLRKLGVAACIIDREGPEDNVVSSLYGQTARKTYHRVMVHSHKKQRKEFSAVYLGQEIRAHKGAIRAMKFSLDGQYLASGGEDGIVRVWEITEHKRANEEDALEKDPSCMYLKANTNHELSIINVNMEKKHKLGVMRISSDSTFVVLPPKVFCLSEKPLYEFHGHSGDILSLSWSKNKHLISSSTDKTVRLWQVGCETCLKVFPHIDYVTCVQFNPIVDNYFISGSIDGKVRIWDAITCSIVDWIDIKDIITAVCYRPDAKGVVVGTMAGLCRFYSILDDHMQLDKEVSFNSKKSSSKNSKMSSCKRITGFQFSPSEPRNLMVTSADSQVRIFEGYDIIGKYKGLRNVGSQISASFTVDGRHIVSASEDSNVYIWNQNNRRTYAKHVKSSLSYEHFLSNNVSVAIPWDRMEPKNHISTSKVTSSKGEVFRDGDHVQDGHFYSYSDLVGSSNLHVPSVSFSLSQGVFVDVIRRGSTTWPEEKLPSSSAPPTLCKSQYKFLKPYCKSRITSHAWGQVIVTASWDGWIKAFHNYGLPVRA